VLTARLQKREDRQQKMFNLFQSVPDLCPCPCLQGVRSWLF
jgi:hypothetical protein